MKVHQEKKRPKFRVSFIILFILVSFAVCFAMYMRGDVDIKDILLQGDGEAVYYTAETDSAGNLPAAVNPVPESGARGAGFFNTAAFIGDTQMKGLADYELFPVENMLLSDDFSCLGVNSEESGIAEFLLAGKYEAVYFMIGMNDLAEASDSTFSEMSRLISSLKGKNPALQVYLVSLLPVTADNETGGITNSAIDDYNAALLSFADKSGVYYVDVNTNFVGNDGKLQTSYTEASGYRLTKAAYAQISNFLLTHTIQ